MKYEELLELKNKRAQLVQEGSTLLEKQDLEGHKAKMVEVDGLNAVIDAAEKQLAEEGRFEEGDQKLLGLHQVQQQEREEASARKGLDAIRGTNEYAWAFRKALSTRQSVASVLGAEEYAPLTKALSITGGTTEGEDGGFLVPLDFDKKIHEETKDFLDIAGLCNTEKVSTNTGWRAVEVAGQRTKLPKVDEMATIGKTNQPKFTKVTFTLGQYADRLPVSNQLLQDVDYLMSYLAAWYGPKLILTRNDLILSLLAQQTFTPQTASTDAAKVKALKGILNKSLNTAYSRAATLLTNQNVYDEMDGWVDSTGRAMLVPDLSGDFSRFKGRPVVYADNDEIGTITPEGASAKTYDPLFIGDFRRFATLFDRGVMEMAATSVGGDAWATNSTEIRVICRMDAQAMDKAAVVVTGYEQAV